MSNVLIDDLWVRYVTGEEDADWVLKGINLRIAPGEFVVLSGFSGVGKSTLLSSINGVASEVFDAEIKGMVQIQGTPVDELSIGQISRRVGSVLQDPEAQIFNLQVEDEVAFGCENLGLDRDTIASRVKRYCDLMGLDQAQAIATLSRGEKQRLVAASVMAMEQDILLLDEPLANLDVASATRLLDYLRDLTQQGKTVIVVEHRLDVILPIATRMLWMEDGRITEDLPQAQALDKYTSLFSTGERSDTVRSSDGILRLEQVSAGYGKTTVLFDINLALEQGERVVVLGENGSGKTTLLRVLVGLTKSQGGTLWRAPDLRDQPFKKVGYVYQNPNYQLFMDTVYKEISFQSPSAENTREFIMLFGLDHLQERHPFSLSEGQKRLVTIAAIAAMKPAVLLLDEPTVGQDYRGLGRLIDALEEVHRRYQTSVVVVTHDLRCADALGDRVIWLDRGTIHQDGDHTLVSQYFTRFVS